MSLDNLPKNTTPEIIHAKIEILREVVAQAANEWHKEEDPTPDDPSWEKWASLYRYSVAIHSAPPALLSWYNEPESSQWGMLFELAGEYLTATEQLTTTREKTPMTGLKKTKPNVLHDLLRHDATEADIFKLVKEYLGRTPSSPPLPEGVYLEPLIGITNVIIRETYAWTKTHGVTPSILTANEDMTALDRAIAKAHQTGDPNPIKEWYKKLNSPTWGYIYRRVEWYLRKVGLVKGEARLIPPVLREEERSMLHYWARNTQVHSQLFEAMWRTKKLAMDKARRNAGP